MTSSTFPASQVVPLRSARKAFTRSRICAAAREMFFEHGFAASTIDQIAKAAGTRRSTLYTHFRDKDEILDAITRDYFEQVKALADELPGPVPTRAQIDAWIRAFADLAVREKAPTVLLVQMGHMREVPTAVRWFGDELTRVFALRLPSFRKALVPGLTRARSHMVIRELGCALWQYVCDGGDAAAIDQLTVAAELFERFVHEEA